MAIDIDEYLDYVDEYLDELVMAARFEEIDIVNVAVMSVCTQLGIEFSITDYDTG